jgi:hypothetical protein
VGGEGVNFGKYSYWIGRMGVQANKILVPGNTLMLLWLTAEKEPLILFAIPLGVIAMAVFVFFDHKKVIEGELSYWFMRTPEFRELRDDVKAIKAQLNTAQGDNRKGA